ncbi:uncharacterized protein LOC144645419 [Oculina patagonica]
MKEILYSLIVILPPIAFILVLFSVLFILSKRDVKQCIRPTRLERLQRWVAINAFSGIMKKTNAHSSEETKWLIGDIDLTDEKELLSEIFSGLFASFMGILFSAATMFWQFLVLDVTYSCSVNEKTKDCFEYKLWKTDSWSRDPIDCNSAAVQNGTLEVVCYNIVFNFGLASGVSYGGFKLAMAALNVATTLMMMVTKPKIRGFDTSVFKCSIPWCSSVLSDLFAVQHILSDGEG